ncbi:MAG TPA: MDR family MFS transporter [Pantanalinema sp.]
MEPQPKQTHLPMVLLALALTLLLSSLDGTITSTAMPTVIRELSGLELYAWVFTTYMLTTTAVMPIVGKMSDLYGRKRFYLGGLALFMVGSGLCGTAHTMTELILYRGLQGLGAGAITPITFTLLYSLLPADQGAKLGAVFGGVFGLSSLIGPNLGAYITEHFSWRWCFYINLPLGIAAFVILVFALHETRSSHRPSIDYLGSVTMVATTVCLMLAMKFAGDQGSWLGWKVVSLLSASLASFGLFLFAERRAQEPILPLELFKNRVVLGTCATTFAQGAVMFGAIAYLPLFVVGVLGLNTGDAGNVLTPLMFTVIAAAMLAAPLFERIAYRSYMAISMAIMAVAAYMISVAPFTASKWQMMGLMVALGAGIGMMMSVAQLAVSQSVEERHMGISASLVGFFRSIGGVLGTSLMATIVNAETHQQIASGLGKLGAGSARLQAAGSPQALMAMGKQLPEEVHAFLVTVLGNAIHHAFVFPIAIALLGLAATTVMGSERFVRSALKEPPRPVEA